LGDATKSPIVTYAIPVFDKNANIRYLVAVKFDLAWVGRLANDARFPANTTVTALDQNGVVLYHYPNGEAYSGQPHHDSALLATIKAAQTGSSEGLSVQGQALLYGFTQLDGANGSAMIIVGLPLDAALAENTRLLAQNLFVLGMVGVVMFGTAWYSTDKLLVRQVDELVGKARHLAADDLTARVDLQLVRQTYELRELAHTFNEMAAALQTRQRELELARDNSEQRVKMRTRELAFLVESGKALATSLDYTHTLQNAAQLAVPQLADYCLVHLLEAERYTQVAFACKDERLPIAMLLRAYPLWQRGLPAALSTPRPVIINDSAQRDDLLWTMAYDDAHAQALLAAGIHAAMIVPLVLRGSITGVITLLFAETARQYESHHWVISGEMARQAAIAVENARLYREARDQQAQIQALNADLEQRVMERTAQLTAVNQEIEAFSYSVSHDLRAPLRAIDGFSLALIEDYADKLDADGVNYLNRVRHATQRMGLLIDDLLHLSRVTRSEMARTPVDLSAMAQEIMAELCEITPGRQVEINIQSDLVAAGDPRLLSILMQNLLGNAWKFSSKRAVAKIEFGVMQCDGQPAYFVRDNGAGFDMAFAHKLFGAFQRLHRPDEFDGTGIGLATVLRIARRHGGRAWATGELGQGATFYFTLTEALIHDNRLN
ncbi:MAG: GAF domain-containing protein, partial [Armatimonadetes bacterium]|nr:GAF domain-containing protein [Anaerolineae bacterium]